MSRYIQFETAALAEAVKRANAIAPTKGAAFDQASGILLTAKPGDTSARLCSTDLRVYFSERVNIIEMGEDSIRWRIPSEHLNSVTTNLPMGAGQGVRIEDNQGQVHMKCGKRKVNLRIGDPSLYPDWEEFDTTGMKSIPEFAQRIAQVGWAADRERSGDSMQGVHLDGSKAMATDSYKIAVVPCELPINQPVTVALASLSSIVRPGQESMVRAIDKMLEVTIDDHIQVSALLLEGKYPDINRVIESVKPLLTKSAKIDRVRFVEMIQHMVALTTGRDRLPNLRVILDPQEMTLRLSAQDVGDIEDTFDIAYDGPHYEFDITPTSLTKALENAATPTVELQTQDNPVGPMILSHTGYEVVLMPRNMAKTESERLAREKEKENR